MVQACRSASRAPARQATHAMRPAVSGWPQKPVHHPRRLGNRADHNDRARRLAAGDMQFRRRGADHLPGLHQRAAAGHAVGAGRQRQREPAVRAGGSRERPARGGAGGDRAGQRERRAGCRAAHPHEPSGHGLVIARAAAAAGQDHDAHGENRNGAPSPVTWTPARARRLRPCGTAVNAVSRSGLQADVTACAQPRAALHTCGRLAAGADRPVRSWTCAQGPASRRRADRRLLREFAVAVGVLGAGRLTRNRPGGRVHRRLCLTGRLRRGRRRRYRWRSGPVTCGPGHGAWSRADQRGKRLPAHPAAEPRRPGQR